MAEALFRDMVRDADDYEVASAGISAMPGQSVSQHTADILADQGLSLPSFTSQPVTKALLDDVTHVFAMGLHHLAAIESEHPEASDKFFLITEFCPEDDLRGRDLVDPFGMGRSAYEDLRHMLGRVLPSVKAYIDSTWKPRDGGAS